MADLHYKAMAELRDRHREEYEEILTGLRRSGPMEGEQQLVRLTTCACGRGIQLLPGQAMTCDYRDGCRHVYVAGELHHTCEGKCP